MDKISIATLEGYYATEIGLMFGLGAGMFASMLGVTSLSKEEEGHTSEFLYTLPYKRSTILLWKYLSVVLQLLIFNSIISCWNGLGIWQLGGDVSFHSFFIYHLFFSCFSSLLLAVRSGWMGRFLIPPFQFT